MTIHLKAGPGYFGRLAEEGIHLTQRFNPRVDQLREVIEALPKAAAQNVRGRKLAVKVEDASRELRELLKTVDGSSVRARHKALGEMWRIFEGLGDARTHLDCAPIHAQYALAVTLPEPAVIAVAPPVDIRLMTPSVKDPLRLLPEKILNSNLNHPGDFQALLKLLEGVATAREPEQRLKSLWAVLPWHVQVETKLHEVQRRIILNGNHGSEMNHRAVFLWISELFVRHELDRYQVCQIKSDPQGLIVAVSFKGQELGGAKNPCLLVHDAMKLSMKGMSDDPAIRLLMETARVHVGFCMSAVKTEKIVARLKKEGFPLHDSTLHLDLFLDYEIADPDIFETKLRDCLLDLSKTPKNERKSIAQTFGQIDISVYDKAGNSYSFRFKPSEME